MSEFTIEIPDSWLHCQFNVTMVSSVPDAYRTTSDFIWSFVPPPHIPAEDLNLFFLSRTLDHVNDRDKPMMVFQTVEDMTRFKLTYM